MTAHDCQSCPYRPRAIAPDARRLILHNPLSPGDCVVMTAALECLHEQYPGRYLTAVDSPCPAVFEHNPHVASLERSQAEVIRMEYPLIHQSNQRPVHFLQGYVDYLMEKLGVPLTLTTHRPHLYLSRQERGWISQVQELTGQPTPYWIINAGTKADFTAKGWGRERYQAVVDALRGRVQFVQIGQSHHRHRPLAGVIDLVGKTDLRQLIRLVWHAQGGVGPSTLLQHLCAAWDKPYVCLLGAREPVSWVHYPRQRTLSTQGALDCCQSSACWRSRTVALNDGQPGDQSLCARPVLTGEEPVPRCLEMIRPDDVVRAVETFLEKSL